MKYPKDLNDVNNASPEQILRWNRFLSSPSNSTEVELNNAIYGKYKGMSKNNEITSATSKIVGW